MTVSSSAVETGERNAYSFYFISLTHQKTALSNLSRTKSEVRKEEVHTAAGCGHTRLALCLLVAQLKVGGPGKDCKETLKTNVSHRREEPGLLGSSPVAKF